MLVAGRSTGLPPPVTTLIERVVSFSFPATSLRSHIIGQISSRLRREHNLRRILSSLHFVHVFTAKHLLHRSTHIWQHAQVHTARVLILETLAHTFSFALFLTACASVFHLTLCLSALSLKPPSLSLENTHIYTGLFLYSTPLPSRVMQLCFYEIPESCLRQDDWLACREDRGTILCPAASLNPF